MLLDNGADAGLEDAHGNIALRATMPPGVYRYNRLVGEETVRSRILRLLVEKGGVHVDSVGRRGRSEIFNAVGYQCERLVRTLLELGADPSFRDKKGSVPIRGVMFHQKAASGVWCGGAFIQLAGYQNNLTRVATYDAPTSRLPKPT